MSAIEQFTVIPIKFNSRVPNGSFHEIFVKLDQSPISERTRFPKGRTLFVINIPPWMGLSEMRIMFQPVIPESIFLHSERGAHEILHTQELQNHAGYRVAYVVFRDRSDIVRVLTRKFKREIAIYQDRGTELVGMRKMVETYIQKFKPKKEVEANISDTMRKYDRMVHDEKEAAKNLQEPDDDGWITVTKHGKRPCIPRTEAVQARVIENERLKAKRKQNVKFYAFQMKRQKLSQIEELRRKFEEDKQKVAVMKFKRKFKPL